MPDLDPVLDSPRAVIIPVKTWNWNCQIRIQHRNYNSSTERFGRQIDKVLRNINELPSRNLLPDSMRRQCSREKSKRFRRAIINKRKWKASVAVWLQPDCHGPPPLERTDDGRRLSAKSQALMSSLSNQRERKEGRKEGRGGGGGGGGQFLLWKESSTLFAFAPTLLFTCGLACRSMDDPWNFGGCAILLLTSCLWHFYAIDI